MKKILLIIIMLIPYFAFSQVTKFMGRYTITAVDFVADSTWQLTGTFLDATGSYTGLSADTNDKVIQRSYNASGEIVYDRYIITGVISQTVNTLVVNVRSDYVAGIQNAYDQPFTGNFPIASPVNDTSSYTYRASYYQNLIDLDYDAGLDNLNLKEMSVYIAPSDKDTTYVTSGSGIRVDSTTQTYTINNITWDSTYLRAGTYITIDSSGNTYTVNSVAIPSIDSTYVKSGSGIRVDSAGNTYTITNIGIDSTTATNVGAGTGNIYRGMTLNRIDFKTLVQGSGITITNGADDITITNLGAVDSTYVKSGTGIRVDSSGNTYTVNNITWDSTYLRAGTYIALDSSGNTYTIENTYPYFEDSTYVKSGTGIRVDSLANVYTINNITIDSTTLTAGTGISIGGTRPAYIVTNTGITGSGVNGYMAHFTGTTTIDSSLLYVNGGNLGFGTTSPGYKFDIRGAPGVSGDASSLVSVVDNVTAYNASPSTGLIGIAKYNSGAGLGPMGAINFRKENATDGNYAGIITLHTPTHGGSLAERMRITSIGRVGIGVTPTEKLHIKGRVKIDTLITRSNIPTYALVDSAGLVVKYAWPTSDANYWSAAGNYIENNNSSGLIFRNIVYDAAPDTVLIISGDTVYKAIYPNPAGGSVSSVGLAMPSQLTVSGSPITTSGTLTAIWADTLANKVFAGPATGAAAKPKFRSLVAADLPVRDSTYIKSGTAIRVDSSVNTYTINNISPDSTYVVSGTGIRVDSLVNKYTINNITWDSTYLRSGTGITLDSAGNTYTIGTTGLEPTLTKGNLTENITGLEFDNTRQVIGGAAQLSVTSGYVIPTTTNIAHGEQGYDSVISPGWVSKYVLDANGDLVVATGNNTYSKLTRGSTGDLLAVKSDGFLEWITPAAGTAYTAGYRISLTGFAFNNVSYWKDQDTINVGDGIPKVTSKKLSVATVGVDYIKMDSVNARWIKSGNNIYNGNSANVGVGGYPTYLLDANKSSVGSANVLRIGNSDNSNIASHAKLLIQSGGNSGGDAYIKFQTENVWSMGVDNDAADVFRFRYGFDGLGVSNSFLILNQSGGIFIPSITSAATEDSLLAWKKSTGEIIAIPFPAIGGGTVTSIAQGLGMLNSVNPITTSGTVGVDSTKVVLFNDTLGTGGTGKIETKYHATTTFEPKITGGTTAQYWRGDKSWQTLPTSIDSTTIVALGTNLTATESPANTWSLRVTIADSSKTNEIQDVSYTAASRAVAISGGGTGFTFPGLSTSSTDYGLAIGSNSVGATYFLNATNAWAVPPDNNTTYTAGLRTVLNGTVFANNDYWILQDTIKNNLATGSGSDSILVKTSTGLIKKIEQSGLVDQTAGYRMTLTGTAFNNVAYWKLQDTVKNALASGTSSDSILVKTNTGLLKKVLNNSAVWDVDNNTTYTADETTLHLTTTVFSNITEDSTHIKGRYGIAVDSTGTYFGITNTLADSTTLSAGTGAITVTGTRPAYVVNNTDPDQSTSNELQALSYSNRVMTIGNGGGTPNGVLIPRFSTSDTVSGLVKGSASLGATYYINGIGDWTYIRDSSNWIHDATLNATRQRYVTDMVVAGGAVARTNTNRDLHVVGSQYTGDTTFYGGGGSGANVWAFDGSLLTNSDFFVGSTGATSNLYADVLYPNSGISVGSYARGANEVAIYGGGTTNNLLYVSNDIDITKDSAFIVTKLGGEIWGTQYVDSTDLTSGITAAMLTRTLIYEDETHKVGYDGVMTIAAGTEGQIITIMGISTSIAGAIKFTQSSTIKLEAGTANPQQLYCWANITFMYVGTAWVQIGGISKSDCP